MTDEGQTATMSPPAPNDFDGRRAYGRAARVRTPRSSHAGWSPPEDRTDPVSLLEEQATTLTLITNPAETILPAIVIEGVLNKEFTELTGTFTQGGQPFPLTFKRGDQAPANGPAAAATRPTAPSPRPSSSRSTVAFSRPSTHVCGRASGKRATSSSIDSSSHVAGWRHGETSSRKKSVT